MSNSRTERYCGLCLRATAKPSGISRLCTAALPARHPPARVRPLSSRLRFAYNPGSPVPYWLLAGYLDRLPALCLTPTQELIWLPLYPENIL